MNFLLTIWNFNYLRWHLIFTILPTVSLWSIFAKYLWHYKKTIFVLSVCAFFWGFVFDLVAGSLLHIWYWPTTGKLGIWYFHIPLEEYGFLILAGQEVAVFLLLLRRYLYKHE